VLSENAVLGFEYGYATTDPEALVIWEAQYGDFANGAQVVFDQFITSGEQKWSRLCGLTVLLPHGYEGAGPEHSSARLERFLQASAQKNIQVCLPSSPAQIFHLLRRQIKRPYRKPLIVFTPKSMLRHRLATSNIAEFTNGEFQNVIGEIDELKPTNVKRIILCSGKVYYDLLQARRDNKAEHIAIIRLEQLYPFPKLELIDELQKYKNAKEIIWCQEEPKNQGAWYSINHRLIECLAKNQSLGYVGRLSSASPSTGYSSIHIQEQKALIQEAIA
jgi:2-oxoglutarate dehydrogenase E1 component